MEGHGVLADGQGNGQRSLGQDMEVKIALSLEKALPHSVSKSLWPLCTEVMSQCLWKPAWVGGFVQLRPKARSQ